MPVAPRWVFQTSIWGRPGYTVLEGAASRGDQHAEFFLVVNVGELMDSLDEAPVNATWSIPPTRREDLLRALEVLLEAWHTIPGKPAETSR